MSGGEIRNISFSIVWRVGVIENVDDWGNPVAESMRASPASKTLIENRKHRRETNGGAVRSKALPETGRDRRE
jgi:hypothetical protein